MKRDQIKMALLAMAIILVAVQAVALGLSGVSVFRYVAG